MNNNKPKEKAPIKLIKHRPTLPPLQCDHCHKIWYGLIFNGDTHRIIPPGKSLCLNCWSALDSCLYHHQDYEAVDIHRHEGSEWKKDYPRFFEAVLRWIEDPQRTPKPRKTPYSHIPQWIRTAIEEGEMIVNSDIVYTVTTDNHGTLVNVDRTTQHSRLKPVMFRY